MPSTVSRNVGTRSPGSFASTSSLFQGAGTGTSRIVPASVYRSRKITSLAERLNEPEVQLPLRLARFIVPDLSLAEGRRRGRGGGGVWNFQP